MICCGVPRVCKFCPDCGKPLEKSSELDELLQHIYVTARNFITAVRKHQKQWPEERLQGHCHEERLRKNLQTYRDSAAKWDRWYNSLKKLLEQEALLR